MASPTTIRTLLPRRRASQRYGQSRIDFDCRQAIHPLSQQVGGETRSGTELKHPVSQLGALRASMALVAELFFSILRSDTASDVSDSRFLTQEELH